MNFLHAQQIIKNFKGGPPLTFKLAMSGTSEPFQIYLDAVAANLGRRATVETLPFNTLSHALRSAAPADMAEIFLLCPWDFAGALDWRSGVPSQTLPLEDLLEQARSILDLLSKRPRASFVYLPAPIPQVFATGGSAAAFEAFLNAEMGFMNAVILSPQVFSMASFFSSGCPVGGNDLGAVCETIVTAALALPASPKKLLVSDLDNVMWRGIVGEDGPQALEFGPSGGGYPHFIYQSLLKRLRNEGTLLACVSRNDPVLAKQPFELPDFGISLDDFVAIIASYNAKSAQIAALADEVNLGLQDIVFVDDNPIEIEEVSSALPAVHCRRFPEEVAGFPAFINELSGLFERQFVTEDDRQRTEMYRRRLATMAPAEASGSDLETFLSGLDMRLEINDRSSGDRARAVQLINKTNQFNLNGVRMSDAEVDTILAGGGRLFTGTLRDRDGSHGEVVACLLDGSGVVRSWVLSCRVFQRNVEYAFFYWLCRRMGPLGFDHSPTDRNEPARKFFADSKFSSNPKGHLTATELDLKVSAEAVDRVLTVVEASVQ